MWFSIKITLLFIEIPEESQYVGLMEGMEPLQFAKPNLPSKRDVDKNGELKLPLTIIKKSIVGDDGFIRMLRSEGEGQEKNGLIRLLRKGIQNALSY